MQPVPIDIAIGFVVLLLVVLAALSVLLLKHSRELWWLILAVGAWALLTGALAVSGILAGFSSIPPWIPILVFIQLIFVAWLGLFSSWGRLLARVPQVYLVGLQGFRIPVEFLLAALAARQLLAIEMTFYGRNFDIVAGATALLLALWLRFRKEALLRSIILGWNLTGLFLLTNVLGHGILSVPYPFQVLRLSVPTFIIARFPVVWLLTILVPIAYLLHFASIRRCLITERESIR